MKNKNGSVLTLVRARTRVSARVLCLCHPRGDLGALRRRNKNLIRFLESFVVLIIAISMPLGFFGPSIMKADADLEIAPNVVLAQQNIDPINLSASDKVKEQDTKKAEMLEAQGKAIDAYFTARDMPLKGTGLKMAIEAEKNGIDWRLLPAIAVRESTGGKYACKTVAYSYFGWGGCRINFKSIDHAIEVVALNLGGNNPNTAKHYGGAKTPKQLLQKYNPPSIIPNYAVEVIAIMNAIGKENIGITLKPTTPTNT